MLCCSMLFSSVGCFLAGRLGVVLSSITCCVVSMDGWMKGAFKSIRPRS